MSATTIFVAHRLNLIKNADTIVVMGNGGIVEMGSWDGLLEQGGLFKKMVEVSQGSLAQKGEVAAP